MFGRLLKLSSYGPRLPMTTRILHFGRDDCHRTAVLRRAGYDVTETSSPGELLAELRSGSQLDAVVISEDEQNDPAQILRAVQLETSAPVILFRKTNREINLRGFALVSYSLERPAHWLREIDSVIVLGRTLPGAAD